jgi:PAS domain-containing protein
MQAIDLWASRFKNAGNLCFVFDEDVFTVWDADFVVKTPAILEFCFKAKSAFFFRADFRTFKAKVGEAVTSSKIKVYSDADNIEASKISSDLLTYTPIEYLDSCDYIKKLKTRLNPTATFIYVSDCKSDLEKSNYDLVLSYSDFMSILDSNKIDFDNFHVGKFNVLGKLKFNDLIDCQYNASLLSERILTCYGKKELEATLEYLNYEKTDNNFRIFYRENPVSNKVLLNLHKFFEKADLVELDNSDSAIESYKQKIIESSNKMLFESSPNGIVMLDFDMKIIDMNPAFKKMFLCSHSAVGKPLSFILDDKSFKLLARAGEAIKIEQTETYENYNMVCRQIAYKLPDVDIIIGIFVNISKSESDKRKLKDLREKTIKQAQELMDHQIEMAQKFATLLGETAAKGEALVDNLMKMSEDESEEEIEKDENYMAGEWDTYTLT